MSLTPTATAIDHPPEISPYYLQRDAAADFDKDPSTMSCVDQFVFLIVNFEPFS